MDRAGPRARVARRAPGPRERPAAGGRPTSRSSPTTRSSCCRRWTASAAASLNNVLPTGDIVDRRRLPARPACENYKEFWQSDGRRSPASRRTSTATAATRASSPAAARRRVGHRRGRRPAPLFAQRQPRSRSARSPKLTRRASRRTTDVPCYKNALPNLNSAPDRRRGREARDPQAPARLHRDPVPVRRRRWAWPATSCPTSASTCPPGCRGSAPTSTPWRPSSRPRQAVVPGQGQTVNIAGVKVGDIGKVELENGARRRRDEDPAQVRADLQGREACCCGRRPA